jgi:hypothetical protein
MYPSGSWRGYWEQAGWGRQPMHELELHFGGGNVRGSGRDVIGRFTFAGTYDYHGLVRLVKQYLGRHQVLYEGTYDGEGTIYGQWSIGDRWRGPFALSPLRGGADPDALIETIQPPAEERSVRLRGTSAPTPMARPN